MDILLRIWSDTSFHMTASESFKKCGLTVDLFGKEDHMICREAAEFWYSPTSKGHANMREYLNEVVEEMEWEATNDQRVYCYDTYCDLIKDFPPSERDDRRLESRGDLEGHYLDFPVEDECVESPPSTAVAATDDTAAIPTDAVQAMPWAAKQPMNHAMGAYLAHA